MTGRSLSRNVLILAALALGVGCEATMPLGPTEPAPSATPASGATGPGAATSSAQTAATGNPSTPAPHGAARLNEKIAQFTPAKLDADVSKLPAPERAALEKLIAAARLMDPIFDRQA